jgi:hypothetical protein
LWQLPQLVDPLSDWCGWESGPGEICADAAGSNQMKHAKTKNTETPVAEVRAEFSTRHAAATIPSIVRSFAGRSVLRPTKPSRHQTSRS